MHDIQKYRQAIKAKAIELGFDAVAITSPDIPENQISIFTEWIATGKHAGMDYMEKHADLRKHPEILFPGTKSVIMLLKSYHRSNLPDMPWKVSRYALGKDYHKRLKKRMKKLQAAIRDITGEDFKSRPFVDSAPVMERSLALKSGLGWIGKNTCLINRDLGSYVFIAELFTDLELTTDKAETKNFCGNCRLCIEACPTQALTDRGMDAGRCISYHTIESKTDIPEWMHDKLNGWVFGCDICQEVCPWNKKPLNTDDPDFQPGNHLDKISIRNLSQMSDVEFSTLFAGTPFRRTGREKLLRNLLSAERGNRMHNTDI